MTIAALNKGSLESYIEAEADQDNLWVFVHIPKTAGSSLGNEIASRLQPYKNIRFDYQDPSLPNKEKREAAVDAFAGECRTRRFRSASGHIMLGHALRIKAADPRAKLVSMLRDPVARVVSDYRYQRTPEHPLHREFIARYSSIEPYVTAKASQNKICRFLAGGVAMDVARALEKVESNYTFIGTVEQYEMSFNVLFRLFGFDLRPQAHVRKTETNEHNDVEVTPELVDLIRECNAKDIAIYDMVRTMLERHGEEWVRMGRAAEPLTIPRYGSKRA